MDLKIISFYSNNRSLLEDEYFFIQLRLLSFISSYYIIALFSITKSKILIDLQIVPNHSHRPNFHSKGYQILLKQFYKLIKQPQPFMYSTLPIVFRQLIHNSYIFKDKNQVNTIALLDAF